MPTQVPAVIGARSIAGTDTPTTDHDGFKHLVTENTAVTLTGTATGGWTPGRSALWFEIEAGTLSFVAGPGVTLRAASGDLAQDLASRFVVASYAKADVWTIEGTGPTFTTADRIKLDAISAFGATLIDDADADAARATLRAAGPTVTAAPGSSGGTRRWLRIATCDGVSGTDGAWMSAMLAGTGDFGSRERGTVFFAWGERSDVSSLRAWGYNIENTLDPIELHVRRIGEYEFELWALLADYNQNHTCTVFGSSNAVLRMDSATTTEPSDLVQQTVQRVMTVQDNLAALTDVGAARANLGLTIGTHVAAPAETWTWRAVDTKTAAYTLVLGDAGKLLEMDGNADFTIPANSSVAFPIGTQIGFLLAEGHTGNVVDASGVVLNGETAGAASLPMTPHQIAVATKLATDRWNVSGV